jgi:hypothetical protein
MGSRSGIARPNVLSNEARPNVLSTQSARRAQGASGWTAAPGRGASVNRLAIPNLPSRAAPTEDARFERRARRAPSFTTIVVIGFLIVTAIRFLAGLAGGFFADRAAPTMAPIVVAGAELDGGSIAFGTITDGQCGMARVDSTFPSGSSVSWIANLDRNLLDGEDAVVVIVVRNGVDVERATVSRRDLGANGPHVLCSTTPRLDAISGRYVVQVWDAAHHAVLASGAYVIGA